MYVCMYAIHTHTHTRMGMQVYVQWLTFLATDATKVIDYLENVLTLYRQFGCRCMRWRT